VNRLDLTFARLKRDDELGLLPYLMTGYPDPAVCAELLDALADAGADGVELGVPFSDPLADGATIQRAGARALDHGASIDMALELLRKFRQSRQTPVLLMSYYNPLLAFGLDRLTRDGAAAGLDGLIVPDVPIDEAEPLVAAGRAHGIHLVPLVAPTSTDARIARTAELAGGFVYCVALLGVTGARSELSDELPAFLRRVRARCPRPLAVGFGISRPEHVRALRGLADAAIIGGALVDLIDATPAPERVAAVSSYIRAMKAATRADVSVGSG
jgi:tryptophan synthase alpha chain